jgi:uncharacterized repeat protein (TIGR03803 family)
LRTAHVIFRAAAHLCLCILPTLNAGAATEKVLYSFDANGSDAYDPTSAVLLLNGLLYGVTGYGSTYGYGTVYSVDPRGGAESVLYSFGAGRDDGTVPIGTMVDEKGILYGTTATGGSQFCGTVFQLDPTTDTETVVYNFRGLHGPDGCIPDGDLIVANGIIYGTTAERGNQNTGTVFSVDGKSEKMLYQFGYASASNGSMPNPGVAYYKKNLYGTTIFGGPTNSGVVFSLDLPDDKEKAIYAFQNNGVDGISPAATVISKDGVLYGTTTGGGSYGGGTVYSVDPKTGAEQVLYSFRGEPDGSQPNDPLIVVGDTFYGTANGGGTYGYGAVFSFNRKSGKEKILHSFDYNGRDGIVPYWAVLAVKNKLYGTTILGGTYDKGAVFEVRH